MRGSALAAALIASAVVPAITANTAGAQTTWNGFAASTLPTALPDETPGWGLATTTDIRGGGVDIWQNNHGFQSELLVDLVDNGPIFRASLNLGDDGPTDSHGVAFGDIDGDGREDLIELSGRTNNNTLFRNTNGVLLADLSGNLGIEDFDGRGRQPVFLDFDSDGDLDLLISNLDATAVQNGTDPNGDPIFNPPAPSEIYLNNGDGTNWTPVPDPNEIINDANVPLASLTTTGPGEDTILVTHNVLNVALDSVEVGSGTLQEPANPAERRFPVATSNVQHAFRDVIVGDFDGDLYPEFIAFSGDEFDTTGNYPVQAFEVTNNSLAAAATVSLPTSDDLNNCRAGIGADFDNDGDLDILAGCTHLQQGQTRNVLLLNDGSGNFTDGGTSVLPATTSATAAAMIAVDLDQDGFMDAIVANGNDSEVAADTVFTNQGGNGNWIAINVNGSNPGAIGAQVFVGGDDWQVRETGHAFHQSQDQRTLHFGLGTANAVAPVLIAWPNGSISQCTVPGINQIVNISQGASNCSPITNDALMAALAAAPNNVPPTCNGVAATVVLANGQVPTSGNDVILGTTGADVINGLGGNDIICGLGGDDQINGGTGNDEIYAALGNDTVIGGDGDDLILGGGGDDTLNGGAGEDSIFGLRGDDLILGQEQSDLINGGLGNDRLIGGGGFDRIFGAAGADELFGGSQADILRGGTGNDRLLGDFGADLLFGEGGNDVLFGQDHNDRLDGGVGNDTLSGGQGPDACGNGPVIQFCEGPL